MDPLRAEEIERHRQQPSHERLREALEVMADGIALKRGNLRRQFPALRAAEIEAKLDEWLQRA